MGFLNDLIECVGRTCAGLADKRRGKNTQFSMRDIGLAGFSPFLMQCPSFLSHQRQICEGIGHGRSNCQTLLGMEHIPSDNHIRTMLDDVEPSSLYGLFDEVLAAVERADALPSLTSLNGHTLIAMDGTQYFASNKLSCRNCSTRRHANGQIDYFHTVVAACIVKPGKNWVLPLRPEFVEPQQGYDKQDCESRALRRWLELNAARYSRLDPVYLGDDIYSKQPVCEAVRAVGAHFLFVCKPDSHKTTYEISDRRRSSFAVQNRQAGEKALHLHLAMDAGRAHPRRQGRARRQLAGNRHPRLQRQDHLSQQLHHRPAGRRRHRREPRRSQEGRGGRSRTRHSTPSKPKGTISSTILATGKTTYRRSSQRSICIAFAIHLAAELADITWKAAIEAAGAVARFFANMRALTAYLLFRSWNSLLETLAFQAPPPLPS